MWKLEKLNGGSANYLITENRSYVVGRKNCDIVIEDDSSVSRKHCTIHIARKKDCRFPVDTATGVWVVDDNSKFGTHVRAGNQWEKLTGGKEKHLTHGTIIRFGLLESIWSVEYVPVIACTSGLENADKREVFNKLKMIDGELRNTWSSDCTLSIVSEITLTVKVVLSLINGTPIVTVAYLNKIVECIKNQSPLPDLKDYRPAIKETVLDASLVSLDPTVTRKDLFKRLLFIFPTKKQLEILREVVLSAGGKADLLNLNERWDKLGATNVVLIQLPSNKSNIPDEIIKKLEEITDYLKKKFDKRVIPESEIAQAIAYSSTTKYCNTMNSKRCITLPEYKEPELGDILEEETPDVATFPIREPCVIPCSSTYSQDDFSLEGQEHLRAKRNRSPDQGGPSSKFRKSEIELIESSSNKKDAPVRNKQKTSINKLLNEIGGTKRSSTTSSIEPVESIPENVVEHTKPNDNVSEPDKSPYGIFTEDPNVFWGITVPQNNQNKRKLSKENSANENETTKRMRLPSESPDVEILPLSSDNSRKRVQDQQPQRIKEEPIEDFFERDKTESFSSSTIANLNNTFFSLNLISSIYLKADGSLIDPPNDLVNVKKFKKQKILSVRDNPEQVDEDVSGDGWIEVHPVQNSDNSFY
ncbi:hypothetical protein RUM43_005848 [Polyplax serrata]|uniref:FHA domain-containing protein n=1 Tax=Polyplax serrata TaxID=468196 RepID=A0AAN8NXG1_POLSC